MVVPRTVVSGSVTSNPAPDGVSSTTGATNSVVKENPSHLIASSEASTHLDEDTILIQTFMECFAAIPAASKSTAATATTASSSNSCSSGNSGQVRKNLNGIYVCTRHINFPIIYGLYSSSSPSPSPSTNVTAQQPKREEPFRILSCRYCYMDETRCGIIAKDNTDEQQSPKSIYQILQLVQAYAMNQRMSTKFLGSTGKIPTAGNNSNMSDDDLLGIDSQRSTGTESLGDYTVSALFLQNSSVDNGRPSAATIGSGTTAFVPDVITTTTKTANKNDTNSTRLSQSLASRILTSYRYNHHNIMELSLKRIHQVQNFTILMLKKQILDYQEMILKLQYDQIQKDAQYQATIKQLRRTIQQDCKVIKTMATQQQDVEYALGLSSHHQPNHASLPKSSGGIDNDPLMASMFGSGSSHSVSTATTSSPNKPTNTRMIPPAPPNPKKVPFRTRSASMHQQPPPTEATIHESVQEDETETSLSTANEIFVEVPPFAPGATAAVEIGMESIPPPASRGAILKLQQNWNRPKLRSRNNNSNNDELGGMKSSHEIFQSFRGGLLDIPRSPPAIMRHDTSSMESNDIDAQQDPQKLGGMKHNKKLMMNSDMLSALQLPTRGLLSREDSMVRPINPNANINADGMTPKNNSNNNSTMNYNHTLATLLAAKLQQEELDFRTNHGSDYIPIRHLSSPPPVTASTKPSAIPHLQQQQQQHQLPSIPIESPDKKSPLPPSSAQLPLVNITIPTITNDEIDNHNDFENDTEVDESDNGDTGIEEDNETASPDHKMSGNKFIFSVTGATCHDKFGDNGTYTGTILVTEGLPHGQGKMNYESGRIYDGEWISGQWHGHGKLLNPNGDMYDGEFFFDARHGHGVYQWDNGDVYVGNFTSDKRHGRGKFSFHNGNVYEGEFCDGFFDGYGKYNFAGGSYEGNWRDGKYNGAGVLTYGNTGGKYEGEFRNSVAHGFGTEVLPDGRQRRGVWIDGKPTDCIE